MKTTFFKFSIFLFTVLTGLSACKKDNKEDESDLYFNVKIDGENFAGDLSNTEGFGAFKYHEGTLSITVPKDVNNVASGTFMLNILSGYNGTGEYTVGKGATGNNYARYTSGSMVGGGTVSFWTAETGSGSTANDIGTGTITVSSDKNGIVEGTFQFDGYNKTNQTTKHFTEGKFRLKIK